MDEKVTVRYEWYRRNDPNSNEQIEHLKSRLPELISEDSKGARIVLMGASGGDERIPKILDGIKEFGVDVYAWNYLESGFGASIVRSYHCDELNDFCYLHSCDAQGTYLGEVDYPLMCDFLGVPASAGKPRQKSRTFGTPEPLHPSFFVVRGDSKEKLEDAGFKGLILHPVVFKRTRSLADEDRLWAVWSDLILPPAKNLFRTDAGEMGFADAVTPNADNAGPAKGFLTIPEIHYKKEVLDDFGEFDVALMREPLKIHGTLSPRPIFSQRFRRFVIDELGVPFGGVPVCIDDDDVIPWEGPYPSKWAHLNRRPEWLEKLQDEVSKGGRGGR